MITYYSKQKTRINCKICGKELFIRNDYLKKHKGLCNKCSTKEKWKDKEYYTKVSIAHLGISNSTRKLPEGISNFNRIFYAYKNSAQKRGILFEIKKEYFAELTKENCYYCGAEPSQIYGANRPNDFKYGFWIYNGVDRLNDNYGYIKENVVPCCKKCNYSKQGMTDIEFLEMVKKIYNNHKELHFN
jgi:hypothetical protein